MNNYTREDFIRYYGDSWMVHPHTGDLFRIRGPDPDNPNNIVTTAGDSLALESLDWLHVRTPDKLGYRGLLDGKALYYLTRKAGRRTRKGVTPEAIIITVPTQFRQLAQETGHLADVEKHASLQDWLAKEIFKPQFVSLETAISKLKDKKHTLGFAIDYNWAVTVGLYKAEPFLLHFKNMRVAGSDDGEKWDFYDKDSQSLFHQFLEAV